MILVTAPVEDHLAHTSGNRALRDGLAAGLGDLGCDLGGAVVLVLLALAAGADVVQGAREARLALAAYCL